MNYPKDIWDVSQINPEINVRDAIFKIYDRIRQTKNQWKGAEISAKSMGKVLHKVLKDVINELNNAFPNFG